MLRISTEFLLDALMDLFIYFPWFPKERSSQFFQAMKTFMRVPVHALRTGDVREEMLCLIATLRKATYLGR